MARSTLGVAQMNLVVTLSTENLNVFRTLFSETLIGQMMHMKISNNFLVGVWQTTFTDIPTKTLLLSF